MPRSVGIVGYGNFGSLVHELVTRFAPTASVKIFTPERSPDGEEFFSNDDVAQCDAVIFAVPISEYKAALEATVPLMKKDGIIVDVATIKMYTVDLLKTYAAGRPFIATHSMFGPESYAKRNKDVSGFRIIVSEHTLPVSTYLELVNFLRSIGFNVIEMSADQHDKNLAETLFLTHFIGQVVTEAGFVRTDIDSVSFGFLMDAVESVRADKKLFEDVFRYNPHCAEVLQRFNLAEGKVRKLLSGVTGSR